MDTYTVDHLKLWQLEHLIQELSEAQMNLLTLKNLTNSDWVKLITVMADQERLKKHVLGWGAIYDKSSTMTPSQYHALIKNYIPSTKITIGLREDAKAPELPDLECTQQFAPLTQVLKQFLSNPRVWQQIEQYLTITHEISAVVNNDMANVMNGSTWRNMVKDLPPQTSTLKYLPLVVYLEDFSVAGHLGSNSNQTTLHGVYVELPFLPPHWCKRLNSLFMMSLCYSSDIYTFGIEAMYEKVVDELKTLEREGVKIINEYFQGNVKFLTTAVTGGNASVTASLGDTTVRDECRLCFADQDEIQKMTDEDPSLLKTKGDEQFFHLGSNAVWSKLNEFSMYENVSQDFLHDFYETICVKVMTIVINYLLKKFLTFDTLVEKIENFDYGPDSDASPSNCLIEVSDGTVELNTSVHEIEVLVRYFGLIVDNVPSGNRTWKLYIALNQVSNMVLRQRAPKENRSMLPVAIHTLLKKYKEISKEKIDIKFHMLTHLPTNMLKFGPMRTAWDIMSESKRRVEKIASSHVSNICETVAIRNQIAMNDLLLSNTFDSDIKPGPKTPISEQERNQFALPPALEFSVLFVEVKGVIWFYTDTVTVDLEEERCTPIFGKIQKIFLTSDHQVFFLCGLYHSPFDFPYAKTFQTWEVELSDEKQLIAIKDIVGRYPEHFSCNDNSNLLVTLRHPID